MSGRAWSDTAYSRERQDAGQEAARERAREAEREAVERRCRCAQPVPSLRVYLGVRPCELCQFLILPGGGR